MSSRRTVVPTFIVTIAALITVPGSGAAQGCDYCDDHYDSGAERWYHHFGAPFGAIMSCSTGAGCHLQDYWDLCGDWHNSQGCGDDAAAVELADAASNAMRDGDVTVFGRILANPQVRVVANASRLEFRGCRGRVVAFTPLRGQFQFLGRARST